jgi:hypothetical protein
VTENDRFKIVFEKLAEAIDSDAHRTTDPDPLTAAELDSLNEIRRIVEDTSQPPPRLFTTT